MRILVMPAYFWPRTGGIETITHALANEWVAAGHDVTVLTSRIGTNRSQEILDGIKIERTGKYSLHGCPFSPGVITKIIKKKPDIVYLHYPHPLFLDMGVFGAKLAHVPYVLHVHGPEIAYPDWRNLLISLYNKTAFRFAALHAAAIVSHTEAAIQASPLLKKYQKKINIIPHGTVSPTKEIKDRRQKHGLKKKKLVLFMGVLREYKRVDLLLRAFIFVCHQVPDAFLLIVGDGPMKNAWEQLVKELGLQNKVLFCGHVSEQEKWTYYQAADLFVLPSPTLMESFGTVALEAAICKKPVIVTGAGVAEVFRKEKIGAVVEPYNVQGLAECMLDLLLHPSKAKRIGRASAKVIERTYLWKDRAKAYLTLFEKVKHDAFN